jgi:hypothetical protein
MYAEDSLLDGLHQALLKCIENLHCHCMTMIQIAQAPFIAFQDRLFCLYKISGSGDDQSLTTCLSEKL